MKGEALMKRNGFTLVELLVVIGIIAVLAALSFAIAPSAIRHAQCAGCEARMRGLAIAFIQYAADNDGALPGRTLTTDKWPVLLLPYVSDPKNYVDPGDPVASAVASNQLASNGGNASSFFFNGFNDLGAFNNPNITVTLASIGNASNLALLGQKVHGSTQYYMDFEEGNQNDVLNKTAYFNGANYAFADGSVRYISLANYTDQIWLMNQNYAIPTAQ
jgi:prepilin-type N-terminal cleavage/methylation domain-containing protein/prepilin-type processing-associated H-X9-DG protein